VVAVGADQRRVESMNRARLREVERFALRDALDHIHEDDVAQLLLHRVLGDRRADVAGTDDGDLRSCHQSFTMLAISVGLPARGREAVSTRIAAHLLDLNALHCNAPRRYGQERARLSRARTSSAAMSLPLSVIAARPVPARAAAGQPK